MHASALLALLPLLALSTSAAPPKRPLPYLLARQGALDLPPSLSSATSSLDPDYSASQYSSSLNLNSDSDGGYQITAGPGAGPTAWAIDTVPLSMYASPPPSLPTLAPTAPASGPVSKADSFADPTLMGDSLMAPTTALSVSDSAENIPTGAVAASGTGAGAAVAAAAITSLAGIMISAPTITVIATAPATALASITEMATGIPTATATGTESAEADITAIATSVVTATNGALATPTEGDYSVASTESPMSTSDSAIDSPTVAAADQTSSSTTSQTAPTETGLGDGDDLQKNKDKVKKIRYKHCADTSGTVTEVSVSPCEGGKGTINDPCHFHAGSNYTITLTYVSPSEASAPRANLIARDRSISNGSEYFPYPGQSFDACQYTTCPVPAQTSDTYTYTFETLNTWTSTSG
ncbi:hypothetical protein I316_04086 [Kwoniella heveanensis BCC8398]|uniref:Phosphatidylglycerol/phosphatidylinositol transfer protein n=1 Tax=Kwoniella heveanensis BCC8398 TaxID=1296120 RepID=A0A1B9GT26_9TREE|nr:hypothetical protein I316_04086 [Kwoniella heveanensis BCC8398]